MIHYNMISFFSLPFRRLLKTSLMIELAEHEKLGGDCLCSQGLEVFLRKHDLYDGNGGVSTEELRELIALL